MSTGTGQTVEPSKKPVRALLQWPAGPLFWLRERRNAASPVWWLLVGKAEYCDLVVKPDPADAGGPEIGDVHCFLRCTEDGVSVCEFEEAGPTMVNEIRVVDGRAELSPGKVITIGTAQLVACGDDIQVPPDVTAPDLPTFVRKAMMLHGKPGKVADAIAVPRRTFYGWVKQGKFMLSATAVVGAVLGGAYWTMSPTAPTHDRDRIQRPAASVPSSSATATSPVPATAPEPTKPAEVEVAPAGEQVHKRPSDRRGDRPTSRPARDDSVARPAEDPQAAVASSGDILDPIESHSVPVDDPKGVPDSRTAEADERGDRRGFIGVSYSASRQFIGVSFSADEDGLLDIPRNEAK